MADICGLGGRNMACLGWFEFSGRARCWLRVVIIVGLEFLFVPTDGANMMILRLELSITALGDFLLEPTKQNPGGRSWVKHSDA